MNPYLTFIGGTHKECWELSKLHVCGYLSTRVWCEDQVDEYKSHSPVQGGTFFNRSPAFPVTSSMQPLLFFFAACTWEWCACSRLPLLSRGFICMIWCDSWTILSHSHELRKSLLVIMSLISSFDILFLLSFSTFSAFAKYTLDWLEELRWRLELLFFSHTFGIYPAIWQMTVFIVVMAKEKKCWQGGKFSPIH